MEYEATEAQLRMIFRLLDERLVPRKLASEIIEKLLLQQKINESGLEDLKEKINRPNT